jgi:hypothetical protein
MEPRLIGSYNLVLVSQKFLLLLIALMGTLACLGALALLLFVWRECFAGFSRLHPTTVSDRKREDDTNPAGVIAGRYWDAKQRGAWLTAHPVSGERPAEEQGSRVARTSVFEVRGFVPE